MFTEKKHNCYCAFCKSPRRVERRKHLSLITIVLSALLSLSLSMVFWGSFEVKSVVVFMVFLGLAEFFTHFRWRMSVVCQHCGFDPVVYLKSPPAAVEKVTQHNERLLQSPMGKMRKLELPNGPTRSGIKGSDSTQRITGRHFSKQI